MKREDFRAAAQRAATWMADYLEEVGHRPIVPDVAPGEIRGGLPTEPPAEAEAFDTVFDEFDQHIMAGMTHWNHPGWFAYFPANSSPPSILAEMVVSAVGAQCMSWQTSPAATELEQVVMDWLRQMLGLSDAFTGVIQDTASSATLVALITARERLDGPGPGVADDLVVYTSNQAHSSVEKAVKLSGVGRLRTVKTTTDFAIDADALRDAIQQDIASGLRPLAVVATVGTTGLGAVDDVAGVATVCEEFGAWLHVDAAYGGSAALLPERRWIFSGVERADSLVFNPHKWLLTNFDCSAYFVRDPELLVRTFSTDPEYLRTRHDEDVANLRDWGIPLGRRFRALKLWFVIRCYGVEGLREMLRQHIDWAVELRERIDGHAELEVVGPTHFGLVCFRCTDGDDETRKLHHSLNADRQQYLTHTVVDGQYVIRACVGQWLTTRAHVTHLWDTIRSALA